MADADPRRVVHADLDAGLPDLRARTRGERVQVFWWSAGVPVGQDELRVPGPPPRVLADRVATAVATHGGRGGPAAGAAPRVAVAILVSGPAQPPERCLAALFADREQPDAVLVVDRGRRGAGAEPVARFPQVEVARTPGGSDGAARNLAVVATSSEIVAFLDADAEPQPGWLARLRAPFADPGVAAVAALDLPAELDTAAQVAHETLLAGPRRRYAPRRTTVPPASVAGGLAVHRRALELAGPFDEGLGDGAALDLLTRALARGGICAFEPAAVALRPPPRDAAALRGDARAHRRARAAGLLSAGLVSPAAAAALSLVVRGTREGVRRAAGGSGLTPRALPRPAGAELRGHFEGLARVILRGGAPRPRHKSPLRPFLARNPFRHPLTEGFFYREKMRAVHHVTPDAPLARVLEIGGGRSGMARKLLPSAQVTSTDLDPQHAEAFAGDLQTVFMVADATALPFDDASFDAVTLLDVLEHIEDDAAAAREAWRVLRPGGWVIVSSPNLRWRSPYHAVMRPICPTSEDMIARWQHVRVGYEREDLERLFGAPPAATADFINPVTVIAHDLAFSYLPGKVRRVLLAALSPLTWAAYALQPPGARGTETAASWRKPAP